MALTFKIQIQAQPERVFDQLADVTTHPSWANPKAQMRMEQTAGTAPGPDAAYRSSGVFVNKPVSADITVTAFDRPRRFSIRSDQHQDGKKDVWYENDYALTAQNGGTLLQKRVTSNGNPAVLIIAYPAVRADAMKALRTLKSRVEAGP